MLEIKESQKEKVILWGTGQVAELIYQYLTLDSPYQVSAFCVDKAYADKQEFHGLPVICFEDIEQTHPPTEYKMSISISYTSMNRVRTEKYLQAKAKGYSFITYISSKATFYGTSVGENCIIMENNVIQPYSKIGNNVIMWSGNHLGHHSEIKDNCFIASHVVISGATTIGENSFLGVNATIRDNITIGKYNLIGAGSLLLQDTEEYEIFTAKEGTRKVPKRSIDLKRI